MRQRGVPSRRSASPAIGARHRRHRATGLQSCNDCPCDHLAFYASWRPRRARHTTPVPPSRQTPYRRPSSLAAAAWTRSVKPSTPIVYAPLTPSRTTQTGVRPPRSCSGVATMTSSEGSMSIPLKPGTTTRAARSWRTWPGASCRATQAVSRARRRSPHHSATTQARCSRCARSSRRASPRRGKPRPGGWGRLRLSGSAHSPQTLHE
jgi:hypothetical protein